MMAYSEDHIALAAEYAIGTLDADERSRVESMIETDADYAQVVDAWVRQLGVLNQMVGAVEPRAEVWDRIKAAVAAETSIGALQPDLPMPANDAVATVAKIDAAGAAVISASGNVIDFPQQVRRWRNTATAMSAIAAALVAFISVQAYRPDLLPAGLQPRPVLQQSAQAPAKTQTVATNVAAQYVALLQKDSASPAFILTVDAATKNFTVRKVDAANEPGRSYELWIVSDKLQKPRSLGVIGSHDFTIRPDLASYAPDTVNQATYAVTVEPEGGSPSGQPTGSIVFTGKLIETVPPLK